MGIPKLPSEQLIRLWRSVVGQEIRRHRVSAKLTQTDAAELLGWSRTTLVAIEKGSQSVSLDQLFRLAACFEVHLVDLLPGELAGYGRAHY